MMSEQSDNPHVMFACDNRLLHVTALAIASIAVRAGHDEMIHVHVALDQVDEAQREVFARMLERYDAIDLNLIDNVPEALKKLPNMGRWSRAAFLRLFAGEMLGSHIRRVIYVDADAFAFADIGHLWSSNLQENGVAACQDAVRPTLAERVTGRSGPTPGPWRRKSLVQPHINSGVLVMDLEFWRRHAIADHAVRLLEEHPCAISAVDQDVINILFDNITILDPKWNIQMGSYGALHLRGNSEQYSHNVGCSVDKLFQNPGIIHFCGNRPWQGIPVGDFMKRKSPGYFYWQTVRDTQLYSRAKEIGLLTHHLLKGVGISIKNHRHKRRLAKTGNNRRAQ